jgi:hypothetical protein
MVRVDRLGRYESITTFVGRDSDGMPPRLKIRSIDILDDARYGEVVDAPRRFIFWLPLQNSIRNFGSEQVMSQCGRRLFMFCCKQVFCSGIERLFDA